METTFNFSSSRQDSEMIECAISVVEQEKRKDRRALKSNSEEKTAQMSQDSRSVVSNPQYKAKNNIISSP